MAEEFQFSELSKEELELVKKHYINKFQKRFMRCDGFFSDALFQRKLNEIINMDVRDDDVWICSFAKAGTTWTQEMVWCIANDSDFENAKIPLTKRYTFLDVCFMIDAENVGHQDPISEIIKQKTKTIETLDQLEGRRFIKTHLPYQFLPLKLRTGSTNAKIIYVTRNPKDVCISFFHHYTLTGGFNGDLEDFCNLFLKELIPMSPYWKHVLGYWDRRNDKNVFCLKFEDMKKDLPTILHKVSEIFGKKLSEKEVDILCHHLSFENMKNNPAIVETELQNFVKIFTKNENVQFLRNGSVNQWKHDLSQTTNSRLDEWETNNLKGTKYSSYSDL